ncbi:MAG: hypothetical protein JZU67_00520, partial [Burkholderiaceae bacterium]|nr:hypothetical protein [Burkholderiaceae bacterium]
MINASDSRFGDLRVWRDLNSDGISQANELQTMTQAGIQSFDVAATSHSKVLVNGNRIADQGKFTRTDGTESMLGDMADVDFTQDTYHRVFVDEIDIPLALQNLPDMPGSGKVRDLLEAAALSPSLATRLRNYAAATTRNAQTAQLDGLIVAWAASAENFTTTREAAEATGKQVVFNFGGDSISWNGHTWTGNAVATKLLEKLTAMETFAGRAFA